VRDERPRLNLRNTAQNYAHTLTRKKKTTECTEAFAINSQSTSQLTRESISQPTNRQSHKIVDRPKAFYITEGLDEKLDKAVDYLQRKHGIKKADRSTIVNALLGNDALWTEDALDQLVESVISQLTSRLTGR
jgi:hypothetical protein